MEICCFPLRRFWRTPPRVRPWRLYDLVMGAGGSPSGRVFFHRDATPANELAEAVRPFSASLPPSFAHSFVDYANDLPASNRRARQHGRSLLIIASCNQAAGRSQRQSLLRGLRRVRLGRRGGVGRSTRRSAIRWAISRLRRDRCNSGCRESPDQAAHLKRHEAFVYDLDRCRRSGDRPSPLLARAKPFRRSTARQACRSRSARRRLDGNCSRDFSQAGEAPVRPTYAGEWRYQPRPIDPPATACRCRQ
jgi:hypothetical protein